MYCIVMQVLPLAADGSALSSTSVGSVSAMLGAGAIGGLLGFLAGFQLGHSTRRHASHLSGFITSSFGHAPDAPGRHNDRALVVLQAEHDMLRSEVAQRAQQIARLESDLRLLESKSARSIAELKARYQAETSGHQAALAEAARLKAELMSMKSIVADFRGPNERP
ncbi:MAG: keratin [Hyphomicrobiaceae bacterium]|nr:keratin [Hyphomicrobiaceae bacterium]